jgi:DNA helicase-2/ATP-dependent DNA helicase PcrA
LLGKSASGGANLFDNKLVAGNIVMHERFGKGEVLNLDWSGETDKSRDQMMSVA